MQMKDVVITNVQQSVQILSANIHICSNTRVDTYHMYFSNLYCGL